MKVLYDEYRQKHVEYLDKKVVDIFTSNNSILEEVNELTSMIMEWYTLLLIFNSKTSSIIHLGLAHSNRILDFLSDAYGFKVLSVSGITKLTEISDDQKYEACIRVPNI